MAVSSLMDMRYQWRDYNISYRLMQDSLSKVINQLGVQSASAQGLSKVITTVEKLRTADSHFLYLLKDANARGWVHFFFLFKHYYIIVHHRIQEGMALLCNSTGTWQFDCTLNNVHPIGTHPISTDPCCYNSTYFIVSYDSTHYFNFVLLSYTYIAHKTNFDYVSLFIITWTFPYAFVGVVYLLSLWR